MAWPARHLSAKVNLLPLREWETRLPEPDNAQWGLSLADKTAKAQADALTKSQKLGVRELRQGLELSAFSHVGHLRLGDVAITILPKLGARPLVTLLRYAYGLRDLGAISDAEHYLSAGGLQDILCAQLAQEVNELLSRGLLRGYLPRREGLARPRGRLDLVAMAKQGPLAEPVLPCIHYPRTADHLINQVLLAGLSLAAGLSTDLALRTRLRRLAHLLAEEVSKPALDLALVIRAQRQLNRLNQAAAAALILIRILLESLGLSLETQPQRSRLPGFLFDMNRFFQSLISRLLHDFLPGAGLIVKDEKGLQGMVRWGARSIPGQKLGAPRPDYALLREGRLIALIDAKYRDIWLRGMPPGWLYQVSFYALAQGSTTSEASAAIIYPTDSPQARPAEIEVAHPLRQTRLCSLWLRPVNLTGLAELLEGKSKEADKSLAILAQKLAIGEG